VSVSQLLLDLWGHAWRVAASYNAVVVVKGGPSVIVCPDGRHLIVDELNPALAVAGSGDVLAGIIAAQISVKIASAVEESETADIGSDLLKKSVVEAVCAAVLIHAGCANENGWPDARILLEGISPSLQKYRSPRRLFTIYT